MVSKIEKSRGCCTETQEMASNVVLRAVAHEDEQEEEAVPGHQGASRTHHTDLANPQHGSSIEPLASALQSPANGQCTAKAHITICHFSVISVIEHMCRQPAHSALVGAVVGALLLCPPKVLALGDVVLFALHKGCCNGGMPMIPQDVLVECQACW